MFVDYEFEKFFVCASFDFQDRDQLLGIFNDVDDIDQPDTFSNQLADIDSDEPEESVIIYSKGEPEEYSPGRRDGNAMILDVGEFQSGPERDLLHLHLDMNDFSLSRDFTRLFDEVIRVVGDLELRQIGGELTSTNSIADYDLPIDRDAGYNIFGLRLSPSDSPYHYLFQDHREFSQTEELTFQFVTEKDFTIDSSNIETLIESELQQAVEFVRGCEQ